MTESFFLGFLIGGLLTGVVLGAIYGHKEFRRLRDELDKSLQACEQKLQRLPEGCGRQGGDDF